MYEIEKIKINQVAPRIRSPPASLQQLYYRCRCPVLQRVLGDLQYSLQRGEPEEISSK